MREHLAGPAPFVIRQRVGQFVFIPFVGAENVVFQPGLAGLAYCAQSGADPPAAFLPERVKSAAPPPHGMV
ncbi:MAG: hypothetical protein CML60_07845 [Rhodobacteraceae bacterium]|nr:hypothetical protein [Paracoccaceae bacterium]MBT26295.1 hypothetical protein [Paracoccaceae bacterium]